jgi:hypothetical protein
VLRCDGVNSNRACLFLDCTDIGTVSSSAARDADICLHNSVLCCSERQRPLEVWLKFKYLGTAVID